MWLCALLKIHTLIMWWVLDLFIYRQQEWKKVSSTKQYNKDWYILMHLVEPHAQNFLSRKTPTNIKHKKMKYHPGLSMGVSPKGKFHKGKVFLQLPLEVIKAERESALHVDVRPARVSVLSNLRDFSPQHLIVDSRSSRRAKNGKLQFILQ